MLNMSNSSINKTKSSIYFRYADKQLNYTKKAALKHFVKEIFKQEKVSLNTLTYIFCSDEFLININKEFLNHHYYTDIITFCLSAKGDAIEAEAYISVDRLKENAQQLKLSFNEEVERVVFHGALHLCGYKDKRKEDIAIIRQKENFYIKQFNKQ
jgi:probable rRNA maturation factor